MPAPPRFRVEHERGEGTTRIAIFGEIDVSTVEPIGEAVATEGEDARAEHLTVDLRGLEFMDATGPAIARRHPPHCG